MNNMKRRLKGNLRKWILTQSGEEYIIKNYFNEGYFMKKWRVSMNFCRICKASDHNKDQCLNKSTSSCPSKEMTPIHVVQVQKQVIQ